MVRPSTFVIDTPSLALFGSGAIDLGRETLALSFDRQASIVSASSVLPPFKIEGTLAEPDPKVDAMALGGKLVDVASLTMKGRGTGVAITAPHGTARCKQVLARYEKSLQDREETKTKTAAAARTAGKETKKTFGRLRGLFKRD